LRNIFQNGGEVSTVLTFTEARTAGVWDVWGCVRMCVCVCVGGGGGFGGGGWGGGRGGGKGGFLEF